jgi:peptide/nickel transport system permease protein
VGAYILRRILIAIPVLFGITVIAFSIIAAAPGDPVAGLIAPEVRARMTQEQLEAVRKDLGLDGPPWVRYGRWLGLQPILAPITGDKPVPGILEGSFGYSITQRQPVTDIIAARIGPTLLLMGAATILAVLLGVTFGVISAVKQYSMLDYALTTFTMVMISTPTFVLGLILIYFLGVSLHLFPIGGMRTLGKPFSYADLFGHIAMPVLILGFGNAAPLMRYTRASMLDVLNSEYVVTARAKGLLGRTVLIRHALRSALLPIVTVLGLLVPELIAGAIITEQVFSWPGMGLLTVDAANQRDSALMMGIVLLIAIAVLAANILTDVAYTYVDPRVRLAKNG